MKSKKIYFFIGTTAELIKVAPVIKELERRKIDFKIIASNQNILHFEEFKQFIHKKSADYTFKMKPFKWPKNVYLRFVFWIIKSLGNYLIYFMNEFKGNKKRKALFIVHGDTITALIGAVIAKICRVKLVHIESGLRSYNFLEPFPEEFSRFIISHLADVHFCPNEWCIGNLKTKKGVKVNTSYNTVGESVSMALKDKTKLDIGLPRNSKYFVLVLHRQEHTLFNKRNTEKIIDLIVGGTKDNLKCVFIMHKLTKDYLKRQNLLAKIRKNLKMLLPERLPYPSFIQLVKDAEFIATDGGSNQEEAYFLGLPCLILRNRTERIEGLGSNVYLSKLDKVKIKRFIDNYKKYKRQPRLRFKNSPSKIVVDYLLQGEMSK